MTTISLASRSIAGGIREHLDELRRRQERRRPIAVADRLIADLEELHLAGKQRVPRAYGPRLEALCRMLPEPCRRDLRTGISIRTLLDELFELQEDLFDVLYPSRLAEYPEERSAG